MLKYLENNKKENKNETLDGTIIEVVVSRIYRIHEPIKLRPIIVKFSTSENRWKIEF